MAFVCKDGCGECCGISPVTLSELNRIKGELKKKTKKEIKRLRVQERPAKQCPLLDMETKKCSVYEGRPEVCKMFGYYEGLMCPYFPRYAKGSRIAGALRIEDANDSETQIGILGVDFTWNGGLL